MVASLRLILLGGDLARNRRGVSARQPPAGATGVFSGIAMSLDALATLLLVPLAVTLLIR
jgi:hypothetical protein